MGCGTSSRRVDCLDDHQYSAHKNGSVIGSSGHRTASINKDNNAFVINSAKTESRNNEPPPLGPPPYPCNGVNNKVFQHDKANGYVSCEETKSPERNSKETVVERFSLIQGRYEQLRRTLYESVEGFEEVDRVALSTPDALRYCPEDLVAYLVDGYRDSELFKLRSIWMWITHNIVYDVESYFNPESESAEELNDVLSGGKSVCSGYSNLFKTLGALAGLQIECVSGWSKGYEFVVGSTFANSDTNHLWNAAWLADSWWLFDCTWGAGFIDENRNFVRQYDEHFFMTNPGQFIYDHFPLDPKWQLAVDSPPISMVTYENLGLFTRHFFQANMKPLSHADYRIQCADAKLQMKFKILSTKANTLSCVGVLLSSSGVKVSDQLLHIFTTERLLHIRAVLPSVDEFTLKLYAGTEAVQALNNGELPLVCTYLVNCTFQADLIKEYPKQFLKWCHGFELHSPMEGNLMVGETYTFRISVRNVKKMAVCLGGKVSKVAYLEEEEGVWEADVHIVKGTERVTVVAKFLTSSNSTFSSLLEYSVMVPAK